MSKKQSAEIERLKGEIKKRKKELVEVEEKKRSDDLSDIADKPPKPKGMHIFLDVSHYNNAIDRVLYHDQ